MRRLFVLATLLTMLSGAVAGADNPPPPADHCADLSDLVMQCAQMGSQGRAKTCERVAALERRCGAVPTRK